MPKCLSCHKAILVITNNWEGTLFNDYMSIIMPMLPQRDLSALYVMDIYIKIHTYIQSTISTWKRYMFYTYIFIFFVNSVIKFFKQTKINIQPFLLSLPLQMIKFTRPSLRLVVLIKIVTNYYFTVCSEEL